MNTNVLSAGIAFVIHQRSVLVDVLMIGIDDPQDWVDEMMELEMILDDDD